MINKRSQDLQINYTVAEIYLLVLNMYDESWWQRRLCHLLFNNRLALSPTCESQQINLVQRLIEPVVAAQIIQGLVDDLHLRRVPESCAAPRCEVLAVAAKQLILNITSIVII